MIEPYILAYRILVADINNEGNWDINIAIA
jgi:hypothetical protein